MPDFADNTTSLYGNGEDGDAIFSSNTDLGSANVKNYSSLIINSGIVLQGNTGMIIRVRSVLVWGSSTSKIHTNGKGSTGSAGNGSQTSLNGGGGGGGTLLTLGQVGGVGTPDGAGGLAGVIVFTLGTAFSGSWNGKGGNGGHGVGGTQADGQGGLSGGGLKLFVWLFVGTGIVESNGSQGTAGAKNPTSFIASGSGGGGSGGFIYILSGNPIPAMTINATGGPSTAGVSDGAGGFGGLGGQGAGGLVIMICATSNSAVVTVTGFTSGFVIKELT